MINNGELVILINGGYEIQKIRDGSLSPANPITMSGPLKWLLNRVTRTS